MLLIQKWMVVVWLMLMLMGLGGLCDGCLDQEKDALLQLKPFFNKVEGVEKWGELVDEGKNCCEWERVECNPTTGRVIHLFLNRSTTYTHADYVYTEPQYEYETEYYIRNDDWYLNASLFLPFQELKSLYLSGNLIAGCLPNQGFERLSLVLDKLEILDLTYNHFDESILSSLTEFSSLKSLYLGQNYYFTQSNATLNGINKLSKLDKLELLDLHGNTLLGNTILSQFHGFTSLKTLRLQRCGLEGTVDMLELTHNLINLKELYLADNNIDSLGALQETAESRLIKLEVLGLSYNNFNDSIFSSLGALLNLKSLYISNNQLTRPMDVKGLINLELLDLRGNLFNNSILPFLAELSNLKNLSFGGRNFKGSMDFRELHALSNLEELDIERNLENYYFPMIKEYCSLSLQALSMLPVSLRSLGLNGFSFNQTMTIQNNERELLGLINLEVLDLSDNLFNGSVLPYLGRLSNLKSLFLGDNLKGSLDFRELDALSNLEKLYIRCEYFSTPNACSFSLQSLGLFPSLKTFYADAVNFDGTMTTQKWQNLTSLEEMQFEDSSLPSNFLQAIGIMTTSLKVWSMYSCVVSGNLSTREWQNLTSLEELYLEDSSLPSNFLQVVGTMPSLKRWDIFYCDVSGNGLSINGPLHLKNLESLSIIDTLLENNFLQTIGAMPSLTSLSLEGCGLTDTLVTTQGLCESTHLRLLHMSNNNLTGDLPECLSNLTSLESLVLSRNHFSGTISALESLTSLQYLSLSNNYFQIPISLGPLFNLSQLKRFNADNNTFYTETEMPSLSPRFQLEEISLSCCGDGGISLPQFLYHQSDLQSVDLSNIHFKGDTELLVWLLENNTNLYMLHLVNSSLSGPLHLPFASHLALSSLDISNNLFNGSIPTEIGALLPYLRSLNMSKNCFDGSIPSSFGDMRSLFTLDLSNNHLSGGIPEHLVTGCSSLEVLALSNNTLQGRIFSASFNLTNLIQFQLDKNNFSGTIPDFLSNSSSLSTLDISNNKFSGRIPRWMGNMSSLEEVIMANNHLEGEIPVEFCELDLVILDLSGNSINGSLPSCFSPSRITQIHLSKNRLSGALNALRNSSTLATLDLSDNHFTGSIPSWIGGLSNLSYLLLNNNHLEGRIPIELCNLNHLSLINLSRNNLSGRIPPCLKITTLKDASEEDKVDVPNPNTTAGPTSSFSFDEQIEFTTKNMSYYYKGKILPYMSGIDLSCNNLVGEIPYEIGNFHKILMLNLSHNSLTGPIPPTFANLRQIESLDLSHNFLSGYIPPQLVGLSFLAYFSVAYNNLSGKTPERIAQFGTFDESSYRGNPFLCGEPLPKCSEPPSPFTPKGSSSIDNGPIDMGAFHVTFIVSYMIVLLAIALVLYINPYWRRAWFYYVEISTNTCYYFVIDNILPTKFHCGNM